MTRFLVTAAALTLSTSALAWAPAQSTDQSATADAKFQTAAKSEWSADNGMAKFGTAAADSFDSAKAESFDGAKTETASFDAGVKSIGKEESGDAEFQVASFDGDSKSMGKTGAADIDFASFDGDSKTAAKHGDGKVETAMADLGGKAEIETASLTEGKENAWTGKESATGMGGPLETAAATPQPSTGTYPACDPGPGDDRCIQLYEPGVRAALASWTGVSDKQIAMGGPFEPAAAGNKEHADHDMTEEAGDADMDAGAAGPKPETAAAPADDEDAAGKTDTAETTPGSTGGQSKILKD